MANENNNSPGQQPGNGNPDQGEQGDRKQYKGKQQGDQGRQSGGGGGSTDPDRRRDQRDQQIGGQDDPERQGGRDQNAL